MPTATQTNRHIALATPLGEDALLLHSMSVSEAMGQLFNIELDLRSDQSDIDPMSIIGQNVTIRINLPSGGTRFFNGYVNGFHQVISPGRLAAYQASVVPWLWFLTRTADCRIFQSQTTPDIIKQVFRESGFTDVEDRLGSSYQPREYCVQYRETDFQFISRLMEREGIYYYFTHENGKHELVLADSPGSHDPYDGYDTISYQASSSSTASGENINHWSVSQRIQSGGYSLNDYDFETPKKKLLTTKTVSREHSNADFILYDYPGDYTEFDAGQTAVQLRMDELNSSFEISNGRGDTRGICAGFTFSLEDCPVSNMDKEYLVLAATLHAANDDFEVSGDQSGQQLFSCAFSAIDAKLQFRPARGTPRPVIQGPQTAMVVGKSGEEIWTDQFGRVKVQFHWDRYGKADENSSCWVRVAQVWAGKKWGGMYIPRIGQEVIVEFLEGDPDRPIITGRVYNGDAMPPYDLPGNATRSTLKSLSSKGGGGFNELRIEDKKGSEQVFIHAEKDKDVRVKNDTKEFVGNDRSLIVKNDQKESVDGDKHLTVKGDQNEKIDGTVSLKAGMDLQQKVGMKHAVDAGMEIHLKAGMNVVLEAGMSITLKAGGGFIVVGPAGVTISGTPVLINSGGSPGSGSGASPQSPAAPAEAEAGEAGQKDEAMDAQRPPKATTFSAQATVLKQAAQSGTPFCPTSPAASDA